MSTVRQTRIGEENYLVFARWQDELVFLGKSRGYNPTQAVKKLATNSDTKIERNSISRKAYEECEKYEVYRVTGGSRTNVIVSETPDPRE